MRTCDSDFPFSPNFNFGTENLMNAMNNEQGIPYPVPSGEFNQLAGPDIALLDGGAFLLL